MHLSIVAPNIKNGGGKELLEYLVEYLESNYPDLHITVYLDITIKTIPETGQRRVIHLSSSIEKIKLFSNKIDNVLYFGNLPPLKKSNNSAVYFHNPYLLMGFNQLLQTSLGFFLKYWLQQNYIKIFISNVDVVACQNEKVQNQFINKYHFNQVKVLPFFRLCDDSKTATHDIVYDLCYVSLGHPHKNHLLLINALDILTSRNIPVTLALTVEQEKSEILNKIDEVNKKGVVKIENLGVLPKSKVCELYVKSKCLVFPSKEETFGLALIESVNLGLDVIAADLEYVYQVIQPNSVFDPDNPEDLADKIQVYINGDLTNSKSNISNRIDDLIKTIID